MSVFRGFEREVVTILTGSTFSSDTLRAVLDDATLVSEEHTGCGYFLTVRHPALPRDRSVCDRPSLVGEGSGLECGFIVFLGDGELVLECHEWSPGSVPRDVRERAVHLSIAKLNPFPLEWSVRALAQPGARQLELYPREVVVADELALDFDHALGWARQYSEAWTPEQHSALEAIDVELSRMSDEGDRELWTPRALQTATEWESVRRLARDAARAFGWSPESPGPTTNRYSTTRKGPRILSREYLEWHAVPAIVSASGGVALLLQAHWLAKAWGASLISFAAWSTRPSASHRSRESWLPFLALLGYFPGLVSVCFGSHGLRDWISPEPLLSVGASLILITAILHIISAIHRRRLERSP